MVVFRQRVTFDSWENINDNDIKRYDIFLHSTLMGDFFKKLIITRDLLSKLDKTMMCLSIWLFDIWPIGFLHWVFLSLVDQKVWPNTEKLIFFSNWAFFSHEKCKWNVYDNQISRRHLINFWWPRIRFNSCHYTKKTSLDSSRILLLHQWQCLIIRQ